MHYTASEFVKADASDALTVFSVFQFEVGYDTFVDAEDLVFKAQ